MGYTPVKIANGWNPVGSIPREKAVWVLTVTGIECIAYVPRKNKVRFPDKSVKQKRINALRLDERTLARTGDVRAVAWKM